MGTPPIVVVVAAAVASGQTVAAACPLEGTSFAFQKELCPAVPAVVVVASCNPVVVVAAAAVEEFHSRQPSPSEEALQGLDHHCIPSGRPSQEVW